MIKSDERNFDNYFVRRLRKNETIRSFDCGDEDLNDFIMNRVDDYLKTMLAVTYVFESTFNLRHTSVCLYVRDAKNTEYLCDTLRLCVKTKRLYIFQFKDATGVTSLHFSILLAYSVSKSKSCQDQKS